MPRHKPNTLAQLTNRRTQNVEEVFEAEAIWAVFYQDEPMNIRISSASNPDQQVKYRKVSFSNQGHAHNLARKLNRMFNCQDFAVFKLSVGEKLQPPSR